MYSIPCHDRGHINVMFVLQHCTDSLHVMAGLFCDTCALFSDGMYEEKHTDVKEEEELSVKTEKDICIEEEECIDMKDVVGMYNEEKEEEDIDTQKEEDIGIKEEVRLRIYYNVL